MPDSKSSGNSPGSNAAVSAKRYDKRVAFRAAFTWEVTREALFVAAAAAALGAAALAWCYARGYTLYYGDAEAHLNIARRVVDSRTPGIDQLGTVWLPLEHVLMLPLVRNDFLWRSGLAGAIPSAVCFVLAVLAQYAIARRCFRAGSAAIAAAALFALNPNILYLQAIPMTEMVLFAGLLGMIYCTAVFRESQSMAAVIAAGLFSAATVLTRYEGWFLIPFVAGYLAWAARRRRWLVFAVFGAIPTLACLWWLGYNWYYFGNAFAFYNGPWSAKAIQGAAAYPGNRDWRKAFLYFRTAVELCAGWPLVWIGLAGAAAAFAKRIFWPVIALLLPSAFYVWSMHSSGGTPIFIPNLWPHSYYNTRYGIVAIPMLALAGGALVAIAPAGIRRWAAAAVVVAAVSPWLLHPGPDSWICWKESQVNSIARRAWTWQAARYFAGWYRPGDGIFTGFGDLTGIYREAGIPLRATLHEGNNPQWMAVEARPKLFLHEEWCVGIANTPVTKAMANAGARYALLKTITVQGAPPIEIYRMTQPDENPIH
jgi:Dolichyl-phosphate-mannose-protein mannosyltransferase